MPGANYLTSTYFLILLSQWIIIFLSVINEWLIKKMPAPAGNFEARIEASNQ
jgi:hypothetical protein